MNFRKLRGGSAICVSVLSLAIFASILAFDNAGQVNIALGITSGANFGRSDYDSVEEMREAERENEIQTQEEGSVLLFNNNDALPLKSTDKVTLLGRTSADNIFRGGSGGSATTDADAVNLYEAMTAKGFSINKTVYDALASSGMARARGDIAEVSSSFYGDYQDTFTQYGDAAIITLGRYSGEQQDYAAGGDSNQPVETNEEGNPVDVDGLPMLSLHPEERDVIKMAKDSGKFKKIIVLLNTGTSMDVGELQSLGVDACLWIGYPGYTGFDGVANVLAGDADPSGRLVDTYATDSLSSPAMRNYGNFTFTNVTTTSQDHYLVYAEGIYIGYKYYETRYYDQVKNQNNATSSKGAYASDGGWDYADEMVYTFGHGLSYASFTQTLKEVEWDQENNTVTATVNVKNNGVGEASTYEGPSKDVVELYVNLPYAKGQAEKSAIQLIGFAKTGDLNPGEDQDVTITVDDYLFATYDENAVNGADTSKKGCYVFDPGDYNFAIGKDAHDALNNVLAKEGVKGLFDADGKSVQGDANQVCTIKLDSLDNTSHAKSDQTNEIVSNQFADKDLNHFIDNAVTYLTRSDWNTYPERVENIAATDEMLKLLDGHTYSKPADAPDYTEFKHSQKYTDPETGEADPLTLAEMKDVPYEDDETWNRFIDQLTPSELASLSGEAFGMPAYEDVAAPDISSADGPDGIQANAGFSHVCENLACSTWSEELLAARGRFMAEDGMASGQSGVYGFGANMHRTPYAGRNFEYYSEDTTMSYIAGAIQTKAATDKGLTTYVKHFCANDQEAWRNGTATLMTEQAYRQGPLKGFEGSFTKGGSLGTMTSNARVGLTTVSMDYATMTQVLRNEWGFKGVAMTDSSKGSTHYLYTAESVVAGIDQFNNDETRGTTDMKNYLVKERDGYLWQKSREIAKHYFYMLTKNFTTADLTEESVVENVTPWWQTAIYAVLGVMGAGTAALIVLSVIAYVGERKKEA